MFAARAAVSCSSLGLRSVARTRQLQRLTPQLSFATSVSRPSSGDHVKMWTAERAVSLAQVNQCIVGTLGSMMNFLIYLG